MLQTVLGPSCIKRASVFEWHKRFKKGRESVKDDKRCERSNEGFEGVQKEIPSEESSTLQIGSVAFSPRQCTSSQLHPCQTIWPRQFVTLPVVQTLLPMTFGYSLSSEAVVMRQLRWWKRLWRRSLTRSYKRTFMEPSWSCWNGTTSALQPKKITSEGTRVSSMYYQ